MSELTWYGVVTHWNIVQPWKEIHCQCIEHRWISKTLCLLNEASQRRSHSQSLHIIWNYLYKNSSLVAQMVKNLPAMWETRFNPQGWQDPLEKEIAIHSSIPAWRIPWIEEPGRLESVESQRVRHNWATTLLLLHKTSRLNRIV